MGPASSRTDRLASTCLAFAVKSEKLSILVMCALKLAAMPTGANAYVFAVQHQRLVNPASGAVALRTLLAAVTLPVVVWVTR